MTDAPPKDAEGAKLALSDQDFLSIVREQRRQSIGFGFANDETLQDEREKALNYFKGDMPDAPALPNRSSAVSTDVAEAVETVLPDLADILFGGEDVASFQPVGEEDEEAAEQETEYLRHVIMQVNDGFSHGITAIKDALLMKVGVWHFGWDGETEEYEERFTGKTAMELAEALQLAESGDFEVEDVEEIAPEDAISLPTYSFTIHQTKNTGKAFFVAVPPDDFTVAKDTVRLKDATYCAMRSRPRAQELIAQGYDADLVHDLPAWNGAGANDEETMQQARDTAGENDDGITSENTHPGLRQVEIVAHYVRVDADDDGKPELWKVVTGAGEATLLAKEKVSCVPFAAITPYLVPHRFYGRSLADVLLEIQKIKTALLRMLLDSGWFAMNQRMEVSENDASAFTISDLLNNAPGSPVRSKTGAAVRPLTTGQLSFDVMGALEYVSTLGEQRSGVKRHSMGLNPDTLHETASGALGQLNEAQKRVRFIAKLMAETGVKDLFLGLHDVIRTNATGPAKFRMRGRWVNVDPTRWGERKDIVIEVGTGSGGREQRIASLNVLGGYMEKAIQLQGGMNGPLVKGDDVARFTDRMTKELGFKTKFFATPAEVKQAIEQQAQQPPPPDPKVVEAQQKAQLQAQQAQQAHELAVQRAAADQQLAQQQAEAKLRLDEQRQAAEMDLKREQIANELLLQREEINAKIGLERERMQAEAQLRAAGFIVEASRPQSIGSDVQPGGDPG